MNKKLQIPLWVWKTMKISFHQFVLLAMCCGMAYAHKINGQNVLEKSISLHAEGLRFKRVLSLIEDQAGVQFVYSSSAIDTWQRVDLKVSNKKLDLVLRELLRPLSVDFSVTENRILLKSVAPTRTDKNKQIPRDTDRLKEAPDKTIRGKVTGENGDALPGVSILEKGTQRGIITDVNGTFSIEVSGENSVLVFSFVGYLTKETLVGNRTTVNISLDVDEKNLEEVVVVGYGTVKKSDLTGSVSKIGEQAIKATPIVSLDRAMQGRAAGVLVTQNSARPGGGSTIRIRGAGSVNASNDPLYVIDGFPTSGLNSINTDDIESIEVLKDASATAIYGSRGANGVILVTTKRGKSGKPTVTYDGYYGIQSVRRTIPMLNAREYAEFVNEARINGGGQAYFDGSSPERPLPSSLGKGTDWQDEIFRQAPIQNHQLSFLGGTQQSKYAVSAGYYDQSGIIINSNFKRYTLRANLDNDISSWLKLGFSLQGAYTRGQSARTDTDGNSGGSVTSAALNFAPFFPVYGPDGSYFKDMGSLNGFTVDNPVAIAREITDQNHLIRILANTYLDFRLAKSLTFRTTFGADLQGNKRNYYATRNSFIGLSAEGTANVAYTQTLGWLNENTLNFHPVLPGKHTLSALAGYTIQENKVENASANAKTFNNDFASYHNLGSGSVLVAPSSSGFEWTLISYIARVNYSYADRYLLTLTARRDGSSRFGPNNKFGFFPSGAIAWKVLNEPFASGQDFFSDLKVRASYGTSGNQEIGNYQYLSNMTNSAYVFNGVLYQGTFIGGLPNQDLRWEKSSQLDAGIDMAFFGNRIQVTADYYRKVNSDLLFSMSIPSSSGFATALQNIGKIRNSGVELAINSVNIDRGGFRWNTEFNISFNRNKVLTLEGRQQFTTGNDALLFGGSFNPILLAVGEPLGNFYGRVMEGIFQNQNEIDNSAQKTAKPGDIRYKDVNNDGVINNDDREVIGNSNPDFFGGLNNTFSYKGLELNVFVQGSYGNDLLNFGRFDTHNLVSSNNNSKEVLNRWTPENPSTTIPRANSAGGSRILSTYQMEDGSYLRFKNISLAYHLPSQILGKSSMTGVKLYVSLQNFITLTNYKGFDPEVNRFGSSTISQGFDYGAYPAAKTITFGANLKF